MTTGNEQRTAEQLVERIAEIIGINYNNSLRHYSGNEEGAELFFKAELAANSRKPTSEELSQTIINFYKCNPRLVTLTEKKAKFVKPEQVDRFNLHRMNLYRMANAVPPTLTIPAFFREIIGLSTASESGDLISRAYDFLTKYGKLSEDETRGIISAAYPLGVPEKVVQKRPELPGFRSR